MTKQFFLDQVQRFKNRFGERNFDPEILRLAWVEVAFLPEDVFQKWADVMIGSRPTSKPPMIAEFRELRLSSEKKRFEEDVRGAARAIERKYGSMTEVLKSLEPKLGKAASLAEAIEIRRLQILKRKELEPNYDPMKDLEWMGD